MSLACLDVSSAAVEASKPAVVATRSKPIPTFTIAEPEIVITMTTPAQLCAVVIAEEAQNLRIDAGSSSKILSHLRNGDVVKVLDQGNIDWWQVQRGDDIGFAKSIYLELVRCDDEQP